MNTLNFTFIEGQELELGERPDDPAFVVTEVMPTLAVWHYSGVPLVTLIRVLRINLHLGCACGRLITLNWY